jgi:stage V sporulation protein S
MVTDTKHNEVLLKVKSSSSAANLAAAIANNVYAGTSVTMRSIGAAAVNQSLKAVAIANGYVGPRGMRLLVLPGFATVEMPDGPISAMTFRVVVSYE